MCRKVGCVRTDSWITAGMQGVLSLGCREEIRTGIYSKLRVDDPVGHELGALKWGETCIGAQTPLPHLHPLPKLATMTPDANSIADCVLETFDRLPEKRKPRSRNDASREWVPLAGIVMCKGNCPFALETQKSYGCLYSRPSEGGRLSCVSLG